MPTDTTTPEAEPIEGAAIEPVATEPAEIEPVEGEEALGDPGKKALDAMKARVKEAEARAKVSPEELKRLREAAQEAERLKAAAEGREAEWEAERKARESVDRQWAERLNKQAIRLAATALQVNADLIAEIVPASKFELDADGNADADAIEAAVKEAITKYGLPAQGGSRFTGTPDAGARNAGQPTEEQRLEGALAKARAERNVPASIALQHQLQRLRAESAS